MQVQFRRQNGTLPRTKFLSVNQQQKKPRLLQQKSTQKTATDQIFKKRNRAQHKAPQGLGKTRETLHSYLPGKRFTSGFTVIKQRLLGRKVARWRTTVNRRLQKVSPWIMKACGKESILPFLKTAGR